MPNWCFTRVCFKGKSENIKRLQKDVETTNEWTKKYGRNFCNIRYFLSLSNFDTMSYEQRFRSVIDSNFRGTIYDSPIVDEIGDDYLLYYPSFETAWWMDYQLLQIISMIYKVEFSAYSSESGMGIYVKCKNGNIDTYDYDYSIIPDYEDFEAALDEDPEGLDIDYENPVKANSREESEILKILNDCEIRYNIEPIYEDPGPLPYGVYYHYMYGVRYDNDTYQKLFRYPELDPFNIYNNKI